MKVHIHKLFEYLLETTESTPEAFVGFSLSRPPLLKDFLADLNPDLPLDWNGQSFQGLPALRERVLAQAHLTNCTADDVLITAGAAEANYLALRQLLNAGDEIITESPGWPQAAVLARAIGATLVTVPRREENNWHLDPAEIRAALTPRTRLIFLTNPNNPTGALMSPQDLHEIVTIAAENGTWLLVDEVYAGLEWHSPRAPSIAGLYERGITTGSVSKALGLQGIRTGWMICRNTELIRDAVILRENSSEIMNILGEHIAEIALRPAQLAASLAIARSEGAENLATLTAFIATEPRLTWVPPAAGLIGLARLHGPTPQSTLAEPFARHLLAPPYKTFLLPGTAYDHPHHIRVGVGGGAAANLGEGLARLSRALSDWQGPVSPANAPSHPELP